MVKSFLKVKEIPSKSSLHWFVHKFGDRIKDLLLKVFRRFESLVEEEQLPTHHLLAEEKFGRDIRLLDSFPVELPNGKKSIETHIEKLLLDLREIDSKRKPHEVLASVDEGKREELFSHFPRDYTVREHEGRKWGKAWFGGKCFAEVSSKTLMVSKVELVLANVSDSRSPILPNVVTLVERGKVIRARKGLEVLRSGVEFFGIFLKMRCYARSLEVLNTFANLVGLAYNIQRFRALRKRRVLH
ncbi:putative transposase for insertion sequence element [Sulfurisphaera tokodaii str. 7]|uniref:Transposase for insertion sequence element n=1 Tax=Sulfurisphaera tokodaii (strain DSM 16993 / JCM 10545 / NBRC 100140 / 7) TaxID=273063 RepID=F9VN89_SULTO|nr:putative transposase for insertion sequence element [Sulfurisphaera tokodaii str. 7]